MVIIYAKNKDISFTNVDATDQTWENMSHFKSTLKVKVNGSLMMIIVWKKPFTIVPAIQ